MRTDDATSLSPAKLALLERRLRGAGALTASRPERPRGDRLGPAPLSPAQEQLWYFSRLAPGNPVYNEAVSIRKQGPLDAGALAAALNELVRRHEIWRSTFREIDGEPVQMVGSAQMAGLPVVDISDLAPPAREQAAVRLAAEQARRPYDLQHGPLLRPLLVAFADDHHRLYLAMHHLIFDGVSLYRIILPELVTLYEDYAADRPPSLPEPETQYSDYAWSQREQSGGPEQTQHLEHWRRHLSGAPTLALPTDRPRPLRQEFRGAAEGLCIPAELAQRLRSLGHDSGGTLFQTLAASFTVLLSRYCGQEDVVFGTLADIRQGHGLEGMVGYCLTPLVMRIDVTGRPSFSELLRRVRTELADGLSNLVTFERLVRELKPDREPGVNPLFQAALVLEPSNAPVDPAWSLHQIEPELSNAIGSAKFDLVLECDERPEGHIDGRLIFDRSLFDAATATRIGGHWLELLKAIVADPDLPVGDLPMLSREERHRQVVDWNATSARYPTDACLHELVTAQARRTPDAEAVVFAEERLSYRELDARADALAHRLVAVNPQRGPVALHVERSLQMLVGMLAILKSGAPYLPLDPRHPTPRLSVMLHDSGASTLLTDTRHLTDLPGSAAHVICIDAHPHAVPAICPALPTVGPQDLAYVLYTSGSTGGPKGVGVRHQSLVNLLTALAREPGMTVGDSIVAITTPAFDIAATELWLPLITGARVVIAPGDVAADGRRLAALIERTGITLMQATPATWQMMREAGWPGRPDLVALSGGEPLPGALAEWLLERTARVWNMYGPTEATVWSTSDRLQRGEPVTIGRPIANTRVYILGRNGQPVPVGVEGELAIAGDGVAVGYLNRPELTARRFVADPFVDGERMYLTGDLARYRPDGRIEHRGRLDDQVKIRGFRVEPGEIEAALMAEPDVAAAAVVARADGSSQMRLIAYYVASGPTPTPSNLRGRMRAVLPAYMVPSAFVALDALPISANGKVNRHALPESPAGLDEESVRGAASPRGAAEEEMAGLWARMLDLDRVGVNDDFFELGGHSMLGLRLLLEVEREFKVEIPTSSLFEGGSVTVASLVAKVERARRLQEVGRMDFGSAPNSSPILFFIQPNESTIFSLRHFAQPLGSDYRIVGLVPSLAAGRSERSDSIEELAGPLLDSVRADQAHGPYFLAGYSIGGLLAYEIAGRLRAAGEQVAWLGVLDAAHPVAGAYWMRREFSMRQRAARLRRKGARVAATRLIELGRHQLPSRVGHSSLPGRETPELYDAASAAKVAARYACPAHDTPLDLFLTDRGPGPRSESLGWREAHAGRLRVHRVGGDHVAMLKEGHVDAVAALVNAAVREAGQALSVTDPG